MSGEVREISNLVGIPVPADPPDPLQSTVLCGTFYGTYYREVPPCLPIWLCEKQAPAPRLTSSPMEVGSFSSSSRQVTDTDAWITNAPESGRRSLSGSINVTLAEARTKRLEIKKQLSEGENPAAKRRIEKITGSLAQANTFKSVGLEWLDKAQRESPTDVTMGKLRWLLDFAYPIPGDRKIGEIRDCGAPADGCPLRYCDGPS